MTLRSHMRRGGVTSALLLAIVTAFVPAPALAADEPASGAPGVITTAVKRVAASDLSQSRERGTAARAATQTPSGQSGSFFKTKPGIVALAVMIAGAGYAVYSTQHDRIKSPGAR